MTEDFVGLVIFDRLATLDAASLAPMLLALEPEQPAEIIPGSGGGFTARFGDLDVQVQPFNGPMPEQAAIASLGMADLPEDVRDRLLRHGAHVTLTCDAVAAAKAPANAMICLIKLGMALCDKGGLALCIPACGICHTAPTLADLRRLNDAGPRAWGVDDAESELVTYERYTLWGSLRAQAEPARLLVGFVPAELEGRTWFFSAGHSLFAMPELAYGNGTIDDYAAVREYFRVLFRSYYRRPQDMAFGQSVQLSGALTLNLERLPEKYRQFEAETGTLLVRVTESLFPDRDWD